ncbi:MAG: carboxypeptidase regulatory-like domain-containing protein [Chlorobiaceae bacterium]|nr:carboxypeptidase regulatory-like domain-containing protein [Chlorobiaceae bacterium]NTW74071.1 carboxypeptidase regulatory-like domain-containing protein [Chlorobiaceae bacterium]
MPNRCRKTLRTACLCMVLAHAGPLAAPILASNAGSSAPDPVRVSAKAGDEPLAAGVVVNRKSAGDLVLYKTANDYWIPYALFIQQTGLKENPAQDGRTSFATSVGTLSFDKGELKLFENEPYISFSSLRSSFLVKAVFDMRLYAATLDVPWVAARTAGKGKGSAPVPDVSAPSGSLSFLSIDAGMQRDFHGLSSNSLQLQAGGRLAGGVWDLDSQGDPSEEMILKRYHWTDFSKHFALRLGTGTNQLSPESMNSDFTGVQFGWNNRNIVDYLDTSSRSSTDLFVALNRNLNRTIEGSGPVAGIAELRFDGRAVARVRIKLDGRFAFENVRMGADLRKTEVYIYERSTMDKPLAILDYTQSVMNGSLPGGEMLVRGGFGLTGNPLIDRNNSSSGDGTGHFQVQYGLNDRITIDAGAQYNPVTSTGEYSAGTIFSLGRNWATSIYGTQANQRFGSDLRIDGYGKGWSVSFLSQSNESDFGFVGAQQQTQQWLRFSATPIEPLTLLVYGRKSRENGIETRRFLLPGGYVSPFRTLRLSAIPMESGRYRYEADKTFSSTSDLRVIHESGVASFEWNKSLQNNLKTRLIYEHAFKSGNDMAGAYLDWYPKATRFDVVELGVSRSRKEFGYSGKWVRYLNAGLKIALQYSWNMALAQNLVTTNEDMEFIMPPLSRHFFGCTLSWDLGFSGLRPFPIDRSAITTTRGGLAGKIAIAGDTRITSSDINDVSVLLDGRRLNQRQVDGSFFVGNLRPGLYTVTVDTENLPIELSVEKKKVLVEVTNGAVTNVNIPVLAMYGIDGRVVDQNGAGVGNAMIEILDAHQTVVAKVSTNEFGDYRTDGLKPGTYRLRIVSLSGQRFGPSRSREVIVRGDYLSGVELNTADPPPSDGATGISGSPISKP